MIPADVASRLQVSADSALRQVAPAQEISDKLSGLVAGQRVMAEIQSLLPNGTYRALINQRNLTLALPFSAKSGDAIELQVTESDGKLTLAVVAGQESEGGQPARDVTSATLSRTGQLISNLFSEAREAKRDALPLNGNQPVSPTPPASAQELLPRLQQAISQSGMFYEAHQAQWLEGRLSTAAILQEPQGKLSSPAAFAAAAEETLAAAQIKTPAGAAASAAASAAPAAPAADNRATTANPNATATANADRIAATPAQTANAANATSSANPANASSPALIAPQTQPVVQQQLEALATQTFVWQGQVWPGQEMRWEIDENAARADNSEEAAANWTTRLRLVLPRLGEIEAQIRLQGNQISIGMRTGSSATGALVRASAATLRGQLDEAGLRLASLGVDAGAGSEANGTAGQ